MNIRLYNARIMTMERDCSIIPDGEVWVNGNEITYVGETWNRPKNGEKEAAVRWDREIDLNHDLVMPGFKDAHTHSAMVFLRSAADDMKLDKWLNELVFPKEAKLTSEDIYIATKLAILEYLTSGITSICEMYLDPYAIAKATEESGMRCVQCGGMNDFSQSVEKHREWYEKLNNGNSLTSFRLGLHAEYTCSKELLEAEADLAHELKAPVYAHNSETLKEVEECRERYGMSPTEFMELTGLFDYGGTFFHGVHVSDRDLDIIQRLNIAVVTNPASNAKLASGIAPICKYQERGITLGIGTDGPASNNCLDMFREMFLVTALAKLKEGDAAAVDALDVLRMAVSGGAHAIGLYDCDCLSVGKKADMIVIDLHQPNMQPLNNIAKNIVYSGSKSNVKMTMIDGRILYEDGKFSIGAEPEDIYRDVQKIVGRLH
ncbi:MAG: amidohydrolase [Lachnospiraceae bacterium]|nr:amidohydrolase [Lachnospiraceae bacterium]